ncbi:hypothetical protein IOC51_23075 [Vibrio parahaemolyticus]|uniref:hypothetical protein n=1 Tax=Vibrio parahaemolyticus TaxID=670 RepID=UPI001E3FBD0E|nr:hypothetical protein [Vibrio parahaemolyticus]MCD1416910.1 hypothetical protein [Vibrio parahaemolyticus]
MNSSVFYRRLCLGMMGTLFSGLVSASIAPEMQLDVGAGGQSSTQWHASGGVRFDDAWGMTVDLGVGSEVSSFQRDVDQQWFALSGSYRVNDFLLDDLTLDGLLGIGRVFRHSASATADEHDSTLMLIPRVELSYPVSQHWDALAGYRFFSDLSSSSHEAFSDIDDTLNAAYLGLRFSWGGHEAASLSVLSDEEVTPTLAQLRETSIAQAQQTQHVLDGYGLTPESSQFFVRSDDSVEWTHLRVIIDDQQSWDIEFEENAGRIEQRLSRGEHQLDFYLEGDETDSGEHRVLSASHSVTLYGNQGLNFLLSVDSQVWSEVLNVQVF